MNSIPSPLPAAIRSIGISQHAQHAEKHLAQFGALQRLANNVTDFRLTKTKLPQWTQSE